MAGLSLIIVCYNQVHCLETALTSVLTQDRAPDEIIIADDASTDGSGELAFALAERHPRVSAMRRAANMGVSGNRDRAVRKAAGPVITTLDADDTLMPGKLGREWAMITQKPDSVVMSDTLLIDENGDCVGVVPSMATAELTPQQRVAKLALCQVPTAKDPMLSKAAYVAVGGMRHELTRYEDLDLQLRLADAVPVWQSTQGPGTGYLISGGLTRDDRVNHLRSDMDVLMANRQLLQRRFGPDALEICLKQRFKDRLGADPEAGS